MMQTTTPSEHQKLGRQAKGFDRKKWDESELATYLRRKLRFLPSLCSIDKSRIVEEGNYHKFTKAKGASLMAKILLATGDRELVEVSDTVILEAIGH